MYILNNIIVSWKYDLYKYAVQELSAVKVLSGVVFYIV